jgi:F-type H+-transporting ATPase subunit b
VGLEIGQIVTQIIGFLLALWILKTFAWKPLLKIMEQRKEKIASEFDHIDKKKVQMEKLVSDYEAKLKDIDNLTRAKILKAASEGQKMAYEIKENARKEAKDFLDKAKDRLQREVDMAKVQLRDDLVEMTLRVTEKILKEKIDQEKDKRLIADFIDELEKI